MKINGQNIDMTCLRNEDGSIYLNGDHLKAVYEKIDGIPKFVDVDFLKSICYSGDIAKFIIDNRDLIFSEKLQNSSDYIMF